MELCKNCGLMFDLEEMKGFEVVSYSNFTTGYDGVRDWYEETYTVKCVYCANQQEITSGWVVNQE